jgi:hypothetical protein
MTSVFPVTLKSSVTGSAFGLIRKSSIVFAEMSFHTLSCSFFVGLL